MVLTRRARLGDAPKARPLAPAGRLALVRSWRDRTRAAAAASRRARTIARLRTVDDARAALAGAAAVVSSGWVQGAWYRVRDATGHDRSIGGPWALPAVQGSELVGACLVGAVVEAAGALRQAYAAPVGRALDLLWDTLQEDQGWSRPPTFERVPAPVERAARVRELTSWNDAPDRTRAEVLALLDGADSRAIREAAAV